METFYRESAVGERIVDDNCDVVVLRTFSDINVHTTMIIDLVMPTADCGWISLKAEMRKIKTLIPSPYRRERSNRDWSDEGDICEVPHPVYRVDESPEDMGESSFEGQVQRERYLKSPRFHQTLQNETESSQKQTNYNEGRYEKNPNTPHFFLKNCLN